MQDSMHCNINMLQQPWAVEVSCLSIMSAQARVEHPLNTAVCSVQERVFPACWCWCLALLLEREFSTWLAAADLVPVDVQNARGIGPAGGEAWTFDVRGGSATKVQLNDVICATMMSAYHRAGRFDQVRTFSLPDCIS